ncbi:MAG: universal stress protein [Gemmata sp.]
MLPIRKILFATDFSDSARPAFECARALARDYRAALVVVHVAAPPRAFAADGIAVPLPVEEPYALHARLVHLHPVEQGVEVEYHVLGGEAAEQILKAAHETRADVIVMGTHGKSALTRLLTGSVAESVMRRATCPVLTLRGPLHAAPAGAA